MLKKLANNQTVMVLAAAVAVAAIYYYSQGIFGVIKWHVWSERSS